ncbi:MAG: hypothetical protein Q7T23_05975 [Phenylobacterium sp.]|nr:hypothetical protein [Phenylobacterium sp.]
MNPRRLSFHENAAPATAGSVQVRQPFHASSVGRWRRYGEGLEPMRAILAQAAGPKPRRSRLRCAA